ncbi:MAG: 2'-5' RNA ligase family protein [Burkholderiales bacterium]|mgnify:CR=1 FL=1|jgi:2'-5' RNA ligase|nr:2'-5' RNA ligase family protein [Burkholderiales bacterium]MBP9769385.1 2'-5' RNA ligase family protein [Burkholderiales bacterium]
MRELYYIALLPDDKLSQLCLEHKQQAQNLFQAQAALRSPAHITLIPPFNADERELNQITLIIAHLATQQHELELQLKGWQHFGVRTIYLGFEAYLALSSLKRQCHQQISRITKLRQEAEFIPHISIINRDLAEIDFNSAWEYFSSQSYPVLTKCTQLALLKHTPFGWQIHQCFNLVPEVIRHA